MSQIFLDLISGQGGNFSVVVVDGTVGVVGGEDIVGRDGGGSGGVGRQFGGEVAGGHAPRQEEWIECRRVGRSQ